MKKILKAAVTAAVACLTAAVMAVCVSAETEDVELSTALAKSTTGAWGQSVTYDKSAFNCSRMTPESEVKVEFELDGEWTGNGAPVEFIFHNYTTADPAIWAKIAPYEFDETSASFKYDDIVTAYGSDDFSTVDAIHLGDCGIAMKATKFTITNCEVVEVVTTTTTEATTTTAAETTTTAAATTTAAETTKAPSESEGGGKIPLVPIVIAAVVVAVIVVVIIIVLKSKRRFY